MLLLEEEENSIGKVVSLGIVASSSKATIDPLGNVKMGPPLSSSSSSTAEESEDGKRNLKSPKKSPEKSRKNCNDEPDWKVAGYNDEAMASFKDWTCDDLKKFTANSDESIVENWCKFHRIHTSVGKSAAEACCFCGGGQHVDTPCEDYPDWSLVSSGSDNLISCDFIASLSGSRKAQFCNKVKYHPGAGGYTSKDACCACNGGFRPLFGEDEDDSTPTRRKLAHEGDETLNVDYNHNEYMTRIGLGESEGIPNLEYLGLGYDGLRGNPRGSSASELDPGKLF